MRYMLDKPARFEQQKTEGKVWEMCMIMESIETMSRND